MLIDPLVDKLIVLMFLTFIPVFELRLSIPLGILKDKINLGFGYSLQGFGLPWPIVFAVCVFANAIIGPFVYFALDNFVHNVIAIKPIGVLYRKIVLRTQKKARPLVDKYGFLGLAVFIGIPLPGTGSWTGALAAYLFGMSYKKFWLANFLGVLIAASIVTAMTLGVVSFFNV